MHLYTKCFGLQRPSSGFYNFFAKESYMNAFIYFMFRPTAAIFRFLQFFAKESYINAYINAFINYMFRPTAAIFRFLQLIC